MQINRLLEIVLILLNQKNTTAVPPNADEYFGRCAGGRLYELQKAPGINR
jgi:hypothetical protein